MHLPIWKSRVLRETVIISIAVAAGGLGHVLFRAFTHWFIAQLYHGALPFHSLNHIIEGQSVHSLDYYIEYATPFSTVLSFTLAFVLLILVFARHPVLVHAISKRTGMTVAVLLLIIGVVFFMPFLYGKIGTYDEGIILCGAMRVCRGELPYQSFWSCYAPGQFYALGALFSWFGESPCVLRFYDVFIRSAIATACFILIRPFSSIIVSLLCYMVTLIWLLIFGFPGYPVYPAILFSLLALFSLTHGRSRESLSPPALAGLLAGIVTVFRHDMGVMIILTITAALTVFALRSAFYLHSTPFRIKEAMVFSLCAMMPIIIVFGFLSYAAGFTNLFEQLVVFPLRTFADYRSLPYPELSTLVPRLSYMRYDLIYRTSFFVFPIGIATGLLFSVIILVRHRELMTADKLLILSSIVGTAFVPQAITRSDFPHLLPMAIMSIVVIYNLLALCDRKTKRTVALPLLALSTAYFFLPYQGYRPRLSGDIAPVATTERQLVTMISNMNAGVSIYVGVNNHDRMTVNAPVIYYLVGGRFGTKYHELHPGVVTTAQVQKDIIEDLKRNDVRLVVLSEGFRVEPNKSQYYHSIDLLDSYIAQSYGIVTNIGGYTLLEKLKLTQQ